MQEELKELIHGKVFKSTLNVLLLFFVFHLNSSGDSGSGLSLVSYPEITAPYSYIIGIVSFGHNRCGTKDVPGVYTNVAAYLEWITDTISRNI